MSALTLSADHPVVSACASGRFILHARNRAIGFEKARATRGRAGGLRVHAQTRIALHRFYLRQSVVTDYSAILRPLRCSVEAKVDDRRFSLTIAIEGERAFIVSRAGSKERSARIDLARPPLLLIDNCMTSHAFAALAASQAPPGEDEYLSLPAGEELRATRERGLGVLLGGQELAPPALTLHLTPELDEHVWLRDGWVDRLVIPQTQMRIEWAHDSYPSGGHR